MTSVKILMISEETLYFNFVFYVMTCNKCTIIQITDVVLIITSGYKYFLGHNPGKNNGQGLRNWHVLLIIMLPNASNTNISSQPVGNHKYISSKLY